VVAIYSAVEGFLDNIPLEMVRSFEEKLYQKIEKEKPEILKKISETKDLDEQTLKDLREIISQLVKEYESKRS